jgi:LytS/YehU family sensor histidine kinase
VAFTFFPGGAAAPPPFRAHFLGRSFQCPPQWALLLLNFPLALMLGWFLAEKERAEASERDLRALADQARAQALQAQLNPHALFNILGGMAELVHEDPLAAEEALVGLTDLYRTLTRHSAALAAPLKAERGLLEQYLEIEDMRLGKRLDLQWAWPAWADALDLPPLLLQPLVENAIKHGIAPDPAGGIVRIEVRRGERELVLSVANTGQPMRPGGPEGTGLGNLRQRLALLGRFKPAFTLARDGDWTVARLTLAWRWDG